jgi:hypothetical protein
MCEQYLSDKSTGRCAHFSHAEGSCIEPTGLIKINNINNNMIYDTAKKALKS